jgi:hypothetical protein
LLSFADFPPFYIFIFMFLCLLFCLFFFSAFGAARHIRHCLPEIMTKITTFMNEKQVELSQLAELGDAVQMQRVVLRALTTWVPCSQ